MNTLRNMKIASKIVSILVLATIALLAVGGVGYYFMKQMNAMSTEMYEVRMTKVNSLNDMRRLSRTNEAATYEIFLANNPTAQRAAVEESRKVAADLDKAWANYKKMNLDSYEKEREGKYEQILAQYRQIRQQAVDMAQAGQSAAAYALFKTQAERPLEDANTVRRELSNYNTEQSKKLAVATDDFFSKATMYMAGIAVLAVFLCFAFGLMVSRMVSRALQQLTDVANKMAVGDVNVKIQKDSKDETGILAEAFDVMANNIRNAANAAERISAGDLTVNVKVLSDKDILGKSLDQCVTNVKLLVADAEMLSVAAVQGKLDTRADASKHGGDFRKIVEGVNKTLDSVIGPLNVAAEYVDRISKGDIPPKITDSYNGDFNEIKNNLNQAIDAVNALVSDAAMLSVAAVEGKLDTRADASKHGGDFRKIVEGVNKTLDSVIGPLNVAAEYVDRISKGDIPPKITDSYNGDFNEIKNNLNQAIDAVNALVADAAMLSVAAVEGKLDTRADASKHGGDFRKIVEGVNKTLDSVIGPLNVAAEYVDRISKGDIPPKITDNYNGDFNEIKNNLNNCIEAVNGLIAESVTLSRAAVEGRLQTRGKADKFEGGYREIVQGVNDTLDAVLKPIEEAADCLKEMANGNLNVEVKGNYQGDHAIIKDALNGTIDAMNDILGQVSMAVEQVSAGSREIATSSQALSQGATESASAVEEISASMQEMGSQTNQNAENATQANQLAVLARDNAEKGNGQMTQMVKAMGDINQSANNISKIIKVIDEIAFQTNLLALNAAVEAARAGKHGKGFTVVAEEVRNLAQRSAKAAKETTEMIEDSIKRTEIGTTIAENTSKALEEIVVGATKVTDLISEIAAASKEQAQGIGQINNGLGQVDQVTQQNTASAEEMASAGEELSSQSLQLKQMLAKFQLKKAAGSHLGGGYGGGYNTDHYDAGPPARQSNSRQRVDVPWGGTPAKSGRKNARGGEVKPEEIISLDDQHFGKF